MAILVTIPAGVLANQKTANNVNTELSSNINQTGQTINQTLSQIDVTLASGMSGYDFTPPAGSTSTGGYGGYGGYGGHTGTGGGGVVYFRQFGQGQPAMMNESQYSDISSISGVAAVEPELEVYEATHNETITSTFNDRTFTESVPTYIIEGIPLTSDFINTYGMLTTNITSGQNLQVGETGAVLLSQADATYFGVTVGQTVSILGENFQVAGIHGNSAFGTFGSTDAKVAYMDLSDAQTITNNAGNITSLIVYAQNPSLVSQVTAAIDSAHPEVTANPPLSARLESTQANSTTVEESAANALNSSNQMALEEIVIVVIATSLIVLFVMLYTVRERTREIGTLKAIGFSNATVMSQFLIEGIILSIIAGVVGIAIGVLVAPSLAALLVPMNPLGSLSTTGPAAAGIARAASQFTASVSVSPELVAIIFGTAIALGALGSLYPAWRAAKIKPAEAMKYE
ncbi:MAG: FtsX-like permease family protein [Candidatus Bathyarchaeia archaeon]|jgi:ABC-type antimicrobial peptide transport system permease subunit